MKVRVIYKSPLRVKADFIALDLYKGDIQSNLFYSLVRKFKDLNNIYENRNSLANSINYINASSGKRNIGIISLILDCQINYEVDDIIKYYRDILDLVIKKKGKSISLPLIGVDSLSLERAELYDGLISLFTEYIDREIDLVVNLCLYEEPLPDIRHADMLCCSRLNGCESYQEKNQFDDCPYLPENIRNSIVMNKIFSLMDTNEMLIPMGEVKCPMQFIDEYMLEYGIKKSYLYANGFDKDDCSKCRTGKKRLSKADIYRAGIVLGFNRTVYLQLMSFSGYSFNPNDRLDVWFYNYLLENDLASNMGDFQDRYYDEDSILKEIFNGQ